MNIKIIISDFFIVGLLCSLLFQQTVMVKDDKNYFIFFSFFLFIPPKRLLKFVCFALEPLYYVVLLWSLSLILNLTLINKIINLKR